MSHVCLKSTCPTRANARVNALPPIAASCLLRLASVLPLILQFLIDDLVFIIMEGAHLCRLYLNVRMTFSCLSQGNVFHVDVLWRWLQREHLPCCRLPVGRRRGPARAALLPHRRCVWPSSL